MARTHFAIQGTVKAATKSGAASNLLPADAAQVGVGALLLALVFYTFHCIWVGLSPQFSDSFVL